MLQYVCRRLILLPFLLLGIAFIVFSISLLAPGDPIAARFGMDLSGIDQETIEQMREDLGLNDPLITQYLRYVGNLLRGDLGQSISTRRPVSAEILSRLPATIELAVSAMFLVAAFSIPLGIAVALNRGKLLDRILMGGALLGFSIPNFWLGIMLILLFALQLDWLPTSGRGNGAIFQRLDHLVMPAFTVAISLIAYNSRIVRAAALQVLGQQFITVAYAKGLPNRRVLRRHLLPNILIPVITLFGVQFAGMLSGVVVVEQIFAWPGIGRLAVNAIFERNYPIILGTTIALSIVYILMNLLVDVIYTVIDPRIRLTK